MDAVREMLQEVMTLATSYTAFLKSAFANFLGSLVAALVLWLMITRLYELPRTRRENRKLLAMAYGLVLRELLAATEYCKKLQAQRDDQISAVFPFTQTWETLHSTESFKLFPTNIAEKLIAIYSLLFRLRTEIELTQKFLVAEKLPLSGTNPYAELRRRVTEMAKRNASEVLVVHQQLDGLVQSEIRNMTPVEKGIFTEAYQTTVGTGRPPNA